MATRSPVNNNFFDGDLSTDGTLFDGRTRLLRVTAPLEPGGQTLNVQLRIADVGDGIFDSAAFISKLRLQLPSDRVRRLRRRLS